MRSRRPNSQLADRRLGVATALSLLVLGCAGDVPEVAAPAGFAAPDRVVAGPQGNVGQFVVECEFDRFRAADPIVHPNDAGASHLHQFFGAVDVRADSTDDELLAGPTTCDQTADTASYWAPTLVDSSGAPIEPESAVAYYRAGPGVDPLAVVPYPPGFMAVAGDHMALEPQPTSVVAFGCGSGSARTTEPAGCGSASITMTITFQDCWDGINTRSPIVPDPDLHVSYSRAGACPESHPVSIPQLQLAIAFPPMPDAEIGGLALSSGNIHSGHADFWNTWDQVKLDNEVERCIRRNLVCGVSG